MLEDVGINHIIKERKAQLEENAKNGDTEVGLGTSHHVILQSQHRLMAASMVRVTNLTPPGGVE